MPAPASSSSRRRAAPRWGSVSRCPRRSSSRCRSRATARSAAVVRRATPPLRRRDGRRAPGPGDVHRAFGRCAARRARAAARRRRHPRARRRSHRRPCRPRERGRAALRARGAHAARRRDGVAAGDRQGRRRGGSGEHGARRRRALRCGGRAQGRGELDRRSRWRAAALQRGSVGLGTSGSGDTLAGIVAGLAARGATPLTAAAWGVWAHGSAGRVLSRRMATVGFLARELLAEVPALVGRSGDTPLMENDRRETLRVETAVAAQGGLTGDDANASAAVAGGFGARLKRLGIESLVYGLSSIVGRLLSYLLQPYYAHQFDPAQNGIQSVVYSYIPIISIALYLGMDVAYMRNAASVRDASLKERQRAFSVVLRDGAVRRRRSSPPRCSRPHPGWRRASTSACVPFRFMLAIVFGDALMAVPFAHLRMSNRALRYASIQLAVHRHQRRVQHHPHRAPALGRDRRVHGERARQRARAVPVRPGHRALLPARSCCAACTGGRCGRTRSPSCRRCSP